MNHHPFLKRTCVLAVAVQFSIEADHASGAYAGFWASNVSSQWMPGANLEPDAYDHFLGLENNGDISDAGRGRVLVSGTKSFRFGLTWMFPAPMRGCRA